MGRYNSKILIIPLILTLFIIPLTSASLTTGMLDYFDFEEADNPIVTSQSDTSSNFLKDPSDNFTFDTSGIIGSRRFTSTSLSSGIARNLYFNVNPLRNINLRNQAFSISFWFSTSSIPSGASGHTFFSLTDTSNADSYFSLRVIESTGGSSIRLRGDMSRTSVVNQAFEFGTIGTGLHHIVITSNGEQIKAYRNGNLMNEFNITLSQAPSNLDEFLLSVRGSQRGTVSNIDQFITYNRYLESSEVEELYNGGVGIQTEELLILEEPKLEDNFKKPYPKSIIASTFFTKVIDFKEYYDNIEDLIVIFADFQKENVTEQYYIVCNDIYTTMCQDFKDLYSDILGFNISVYDAFYNDEALYSPPDDDFQIWFSQPLSSYTLNFNAKYNETRLFYSYVISFPDSQFNFGGNEILFLATNTPENDPSFEEVTLLKSFTVPNIKKGEVFLYDVNTLSNNFEGYWLQILVDGEWKTYQFNDDIQTKYALYEKRSEVLRITGTENNVGKQDKDIIRLVVYNDYTSKNTESRTINVIEEDVSIGVPDDTATLRGIQKVLGIFPSSSSLTTAEKMFISLFVMFITILMLFLVAYATENYTIFTPIISVVVILQIVFFTLIGYIPVWIIVLISIIAIGMFTYFIKRPFTQSTP